MNWTTNWTWKKIGIVAGIAALLLGIAYTAGIFTRPAKVVEKIVEKEKIVIDQKSIQEAVSKAQAEWKKNEKVKTTTHIIYKEGKPIEKIVYKDRETNSAGSSASMDASIVVSTTVVEKVKVVEKEKIVVAKKDRWRLGMGAGIDWDNLPTSLSLKDFDYEFHGELRAIGGLWCGVSTVPQLHYVGLTLSFQN